MSDEDTEFMFLEKRIQREEDKKVESYMRRAQIESVRFCETYAQDLPVMTLRKAFEIGFRMGFSSAKGDK